MPKGDEFSPFFTLTGPSIGYSTKDIVDNPEVRDDVVQTLWRGELFNREIKVNGEMTHQVDDRDAATSIFLRHRRDDKATEAWTFKERMVHPRRPKLTYMGGAEALKAHFDMVYCPKYPPFNESIWEESQDEDTDNFLDKGEKALKNIAYRSDPSMDPGKAEIFLKAQSVTKR